MFVSNCRKEIFYLTMHLTHFVYKDHSDIEKGNSLPLSFQIFSICFSLIFFFWGGGFFCLFVVCFCLFCVYLFVLFCFVGFFCFFNYERY